MLSEPESCPLPLSDKHGLSETLRAERGYWRGLAVSK
jgi:hypothetical protein